MKPSDKTASPGKPDPSDLGKSEAFIAHWKSLPKHSLLPSLQDFLDRPEPIVQPDIAILDISSAGEIAVRLYGTQRVKTFNHNFTGSETPLQAYQGEIEQQARTVLGQTIKTPCGWRSTVLFESSTQKRHLRTIATLLPLGNEAKNMHSLLHHQYLIDEVDPDEYPKIVKGVIDGEYFDIGAGVPD